MSKYIKLEGLKWHSPDESLVKPLIEFYVTESDIADLPTIEVSEDCIDRAEALKAYNDAIEELVKAEMEEFNLGDFTECSFNTTQLKLIARKIWDAPSVVPCCNNEESNKVQQAEDCISREWVKGICEAMLDEEMLGHMLGYIEDAPSVVPKTQIETQIEIQNSNENSSEDAISREYLFSKVYDMDNDDLVVDLKDIENAPSVIPKPKEGEWIDKGDYAECSNCGAHSGTQYDGVEPIPLETKYCPDCGKKMKGADDE